MPIPESQLQTWSNQGATVTSTATYTAVKTALSANTSPIKDLISSGKVEVFLQGSYAGYTNIHGDSDVDVVVLLKKTFSSNKQDLPVDQFLAHEQTYSSATYNLSDFRKDVIIALEMYFGKRFIDCTSNKSLKVLRSSGRLPADVVPALSYRRYSFFKSDNVHSKVDGICFNHRETGKQIVNYPKLHLRHGEVKNSSVATNGNYKHLVRIFKNARTYLVNQGDLAKETAPSYFLQNLVYNIPDPIIKQGTWSEIYPKALNFLANADKSSFICQNNQHKLFGEGDDQWNTQDANETIRQLIELWNNWYE